MVAWERGEDTSVRVSVSVRGRILAGRIWVVRGQGNFGIWAVHTSRTGKSGERGRLWWKEAADVFLIVKLGGPESLRTPRRNTVILAFRTEPSHYNPAISLIL